MRRQREEGDGVASGEPPYRDVAPEPYRDEEEETRVAARAQREPYGDPGAGYGYGPPGPGYGPGPWRGPWAGRWGYGGGPRPGLPIETKPFFLTSEFAAVLVAIIALGITAGASESIDAWRFWILTTVLVSFYVLSRGIAKSGTKSRSADPREELLRPRGGGEGRERQ
jgi:hypothetical protein